MTREETLALLGDARQEDGCRVKLCGLSRPEDVTAANAARPDLVGFVVDFPKSIRNVPASALAELTRGVDEGIARVGVFVNEPIEMVAELYRQKAIDIAQLHGSEDEGYIARLREVCDVPLIQAFRVRTAADVACAEESSADLVLLDNGQGTGASFDWALVQNVGRPFMLAGGLGPHNVAEAARAVRPWGVDMSSGIETDGHKDHDKMMAAVAALRR